MFDVVDYKHADKAALAEIAIRMKCVQLQLSWLW